MSKREESQEEEEEEEERRRRCVQCEGMILPTMQASSPSPPARFISQNPKPESSELADSVFVMSLILTDFSDNSLVKGLFQIIIFINKLFSKKGLRFQHQDMTFQE